MPRFNPEAGAFFEASLKKQARTEKSPETKPGGIDITEPDMSKNQAEEAYKDIAKELNTAAEDSQETPPEVIDDLQESPKKKRAFMDRLPQPSKKLILALGFAIFLGAATATAKAGEYRKSSQGQHQKGKTYYPLKFFKEKLVPELSMVHRAEKGVMFGRALRNPDGTILYDNNGAVREQNGIDDELQRHIPGRWRVRETESQKIRQFEIYDNAKLFEGWSIQEKSVKLPNGKTFEYYGPWADNGCAPDEMIMYSSGYLDSFPTGPFPSKNVRAWRPGPTIHPAKMADRFYRVQNLRSNIGKGLTASFGGRVSLDDMNFWVMWEMYRNDSNNEEFLQHSDLVKTIESYRKIFWEKDWKGLAQREEAAKKEYRAQKKEAKKKAKAQRKAARKAHSEQQNRDKQKARQRTGIR